VLRVSACRAVLLVDVSEMLKKLVVSISYVIENLLGLSVEPQRLDS